jgi:hypothetical protein
MKKFTKTKCSLVKIALLCFFSLNSCRSICQPTNGKKNEKKDNSTNLVTETTVDKFWSEFLEYDCSKAIQKIDSPKAKQKTVLAKYYLIQAYESFCKNDEPALEGFLVLIDNVLSELNSPGREQLVRDKFYGKLTDLGNRRIDRAKNEAKVGAIDDQKKRKEDALAKIKPDFKKTDEAIKLSIAKNNPSNVNPCFNSKVDYQILTETNGIELRLTTVFCDEGQVEGPYLGLAQIGMTAYYSEIAQWLLGDVISEWCVGNIEDCKNEIEVWIEGHTDGNPINEELDYGDDAFSIPTGTKYSNTSDDNKLTLQVIEEEVTNKLSTNEILGLVRCWIAAKEFQKITNSPIQLQSVQHPKTEKGEEFRKVVVIVRAKNLFAKDLEALTSKYLKIYEKKIQKIEKSHNNKIRT